MIGQREKIVAVGAVIGCHKSGQIIPVRTAGMEVQIASVRIASGKILVHAIDGKPLVAVAGVVKQADEIFLLGRERMGEYKRGIVLGRGGDAARRACGCRRVIDGITVIQTEDLNGVRALGIETHLTYGADADGDLFLRGHDFRENVELHELTADGKYHNLPRFHNELRLCRYGKYSKDLRFAQEENLKFSGESGSAPYGSDRVSLCVRDLSMKTLASLVNEAAAMPP